MPHVQVQISARLVWLPVSEFVAAKVIFRFRELFKGWIRSSHVGWSQSLSVPLLQAKVWRSRHWHWAATLSKRLRCGLVWLTHCLGVMCLINVMWCKPWPCTLDDMILTWSKDCPPGFTCVVCRVKPTSQICKECFYVLRGSFAGSKQTEVCEAIQAHETVKEKFLCRLVIGCFWFKFKSFSFTSSMSPWNIIRWSMIMMKG